MCVVACSQPSKFNSAPIEGSSSSNTSPNSQSFYGSNINSPNSSPGQPNTHSSQPQSTSGGAHIHKPKLLNTMDKQNSGQDFKQVESKDKANVLATIPEDRPARHGRGIQYPYYNILVL